MERGITRSRDAASTSATARAMGRERVRTSEQGSESAKARVGLPASQRVSERREGQARAVVNVKTDVGGRASEREEEHRSCCASGEHSAPCARRAPPEHDGLRQRAQHGRPARDAAPRVEANADNAQPRARLTHESLQRQGAAPRLLNRRARVSARDGWGAWDESKEFRQMEQKGGGY
eukprot:4603365-Pleurochrysis_carterae.AAC.1